MPGTLKIVSMMNEPVTRNARVGPRIVTTGMSAFRIMWRETTSRPPMPLLCAVRM